MLFVIDRFEGNYAICVILGTTTLIDINLSMIPKNAKEGTILKLEDGGFAICSEEELKIREEMQDKMNRLFD